MLNGQNSNQSSQKNAPDTSATSSGPLRVAVIGAGVSGIGMACKLLEAGEDNFLVFEREQGIGGTWFQNRYPGSGCDIESNLYSFSYAQNKRWSRKFAKREEIHQYLVECAEKFGIMSYVRCNHELVSARWEEEISLWQLETSQGHFQARVLVCCTGYLSEPKYPDIPGLDSYSGQVVHPAHWDEDIELDGKRVGLVGTGATTVQIVPAIQQQVDSLKVFQRSSGWVVPKDDKPNEGWHAWAMQHVPGYQQLLRMYAFWTSESHIWFMQSPKRIGIPQKDAEKHLERLISDPELRKKLRPEHMVGCKRFLFSNDYYPALEKPNVDLITDPIESVSSSGLVTANGVEHPVDIIITATGYRATKSQFAERIVGESGRTLGEQWSEGQYAFLGMNVPGFPNFFFLMGPNTNVAHTSAILMSELQVKYTVDAIQAMKTRNYSTIDVKPDVLEKFNDEVQAAIKKGVWSVGCQSWYIDENGRNTAVWPFSVPNYKKRTRKFDPDCYNVA